MFLLSDFESTILYRGKSTYFQEIFKAFSQVLARFYTNGIFKNSRISKNTLLLYKKNAIMY